MGEFRAIAKKTVTGRVAEAGMIGAIASWCEFLQGKATFSEALADMAEGLGAEAVVLSRVSRDEPRNAKILQHDQRRGHSRMTELKRSYARAVLGTYFEKPKTGSIWFKSMLEHDVDPSLDGFHSSRSLADLVVIPLAVDDKTIDFAEIHFASALLFEHRALLNMVADTLARTWKNRASGLMTEIFSKSPLRLSKEDATAPILSMENPARLSRAEYRVCLLLSRGQTFEKVQTELSISSSTLRTHLKNIYAKTETANQAELLFRLLTFAPTQEQPFGRAASA